MTAATEAPVQGRTGTPLSVALVEFNPSGGLFQFAVQLGEALADRGHRVELLTGPDPERLPAARLRRGALPAHLARQRRRRRPPAGPQGSPAGARGALPPRVGGARAPAGRDRPDVVQFSGAWFPVDGIAMAGLARRRGYRPLLTAVAHAPAPFNEQRANGEVFKRSCAAGPHPGTAAREPRGERRCWAKRHLCGSTCALAYPALPEPAVVPHGDEGVPRSRPTCRASDASAPSGAVLRHDAGIQGARSAGPAPGRMVPPAAAGRPAGVRRAQPSGDTDLGRAPGAPRPPSGGVDVACPGYVPLDAVAGILRRPPASSFAPYRYANASGVVELARLPFARSRRRH